MKRIILALSFFLLFLFGFSGYSLAGGGCIWPSENSYLEANKTTAVANGSDSITITAYSGCRNIDGSWGFSNEDELKLIVSGEGNTVSPEQQNNNSRAVNFSITSTIAGEKTVQMQYLNIDHAWQTVGSSIRVTFNADSSSQSTSEAQSAATSTSTSTRSRNNNTTQTNAETVTNTKPSAPVALTINNAQLSADKTINQTLTVGSQIVISGTATPNATIKLYIYSDPITAETKADANGSWTYTITQALALGAHRVEAETVDATGATSDRIEVAKFTLAGQTTPSSNNSLISVLSPTIYFLSGVLLIFVAGLITVIIIRKRKNNKTDLQSQQLN